MSEILCNCKSNDIVKTSDIYQSKVKRCTWLFNCSVHIYQNHKSLKGSDKLNRVVTADKD